MRRGIAIGLSFVGANLLLLLLLRVPAPMAAYTAFIFAGLVSIADAIDERRGD